MDFPYITKRNAIKMYFDVVHTKKVIAKLCKTDNNNNSNNDNEKRKIVFDKSYASKRSKKKVQNERTFCAHEIVFVCMCCQCGFCRSQLPQTKWKNREEVKNKNWVFFCCCSCLLRLPTYCCWRHTTEYRVWYNCI